MADVSASRSLFLTSEMSGYNFTAPIMNRVSAQMTTYFWRKSRVFVFSVGNEWREHSAPYDAKHKCRVFVFSVGNEWREHSAPYDAKINVWCLLLRFEMNYGNIRLRMTLK